jgi:hypothetical protein
MLGGDGSPWVGLCICNRGGSVSSDVWQHVAFCKCLEGFDPPVQPVDVDVDRLRALQKKLRSDRLEGPRDGVRWKSNRNWVTMEVRPVYGQMNE